MKIAVFDLDHTLMPMDTGDAWTRFLLRVSNTDPEFAYSELDRFAREYEAHTLVIDEFYDFHMKLLASYRYEDLVHWRSEYVRRCVRPNIPQKSRDLVRSYKEQGYTTVLCSATVSFVTSAVAELFGIDVNLGTESEMTTEGEFAGVMRGTNTYQEGKVRHLKAWLAGMDIDKPEALVFYSDSAADLPMFEYTETQGGTCIATNPSEELAMTACARGWQVIHTFDEADLARAAATVAEATA